MGQYQILHGLPEPLDEEEQAELFKKYYETKNEEYRDILVFRNLKLAASVVQKYYSNTSVELEDLFQIACLELVNIVEKYNPELGYSFSTFAVTSLRNRLIRSVVKAGNEIKPASLDEPLRDGTDNLLYDDLFLIDTITDKDEISIEKDFLIKEKMIKIWDWVHENCSKLEIIVFEETSGFNSASIKSCLDIAEELNLSKQRVYKIRDTVRTKIQKKFFKEKEVRKEKQ